MSQSIKTLVNICLFNGLTFNTGGTWQWAFYQES